MTTTPTALEVILAITLAALLWRSLREGRGRADAVIQRMARKDPSLLMELSKIAQGSPYALPEVAMAYHRIFGAYRDHLRTITAVRAATPIGCLHVAVASAEAHGARVRA